MEASTQETTEKRSEMMLEDVDLTLEEVSKHPILERVAKRIADDVRTTSHTAHNSHYSSNT
jgi:hypothetical protein